MTDSQAHSVEVLNTLYSAERRNCLRRLGETAGPSDHPFLVHDDDTVFASWQTRQEGYRLLPAAE